MKWDRDVVSRLDELWASGLSASKIASILSAEFREPITKNSVIGARRRNLLRARVKKSKAFIGKQKIEIKKEESDKKCQILELTNITCRYPIDHGWFCGKQIKENSSYCTDHHYLCHIKGSKIKLTTA